LAVSGQLRVIPSSRSRVLPFSDVSPEEIGRQLNVRCAVVCAAVLRDRFIDLRVDAIDVLAETVLASETLLSSTDRVLTLQDEAAHLIAEHFGVGDQMTRRARVRSEQCSYARCLKGRALARRGEHSAALAVYRQAIDVAPDQVATLVEFVKFVGTVPCGAVDLSTGLAAREAIERAL